MVYKVAVLDLYQQDKIGLYKRTYRLNAKTPEEAKEIMLEAIIRQALERDDLDVIEADNVVIVYGLKNYVISDVFFILSIQPAEHQFGSTDDGEG